MSEFFKVTLTGVENSGKTTLAAKLAEELGWPLVLEKCRENEDVINGKETPVTLVEINKQQELAVKKHKASGVRGVICDTGGVVLEVWSEEKFGERINCNELVPTDLYIYCKTLPRWQADPLRLMPHYMDRTMYEFKFDAKLAKMGVGVLVLEAMDTELRLDLAVKQIKSMLDE
jgi:nicotinamide riboside kinase